MSEEDFTFLDKKVHINKGSRWIEKKVLDNKTGSEFTIFQLDITYREIPYIFEEPDRINGTELLPSNTSVESLEQIHWAPYRPNAIKTFLLDHLSLCDGAVEVKNCHDKFYVGIEVEVLSLDLDFGLGDYLLIGPGNKAELWNNSRAQIIGHKIDRQEAERNPHRFWIHAESAFVRYETYTIEESNKMLQIQNRNPQLSA